jgi:hypothetical protein
MRTAESNVKNLSVAPIPIEWRSAMPIYASEAFLKAVSDEYGWLGGTNVEGERRCILPYTIIRKFGFRFVRFRVQTIPLQDGFDVREETSFLNSAVEFFRSEGADMIIPGSATAMFSTCPDGAVVAPYGTFINDLARPEEVIFKEIHADYRKKIRSAINAGVQIRCGMQYLDECYEIIVNTLKRSGAEVVKKYDDFKNTILSLDRNVKIFVADHQGTIQACLVSPFSEYSAYTFYGGTISEPLKGAMHLVHWEAMRHFREMGVRQFNFQGVRVNPERGSKHEGIRIFKQRFGGKFVQGYLWKHSLNPLKSAVYSVAVRLLKGGDIVDQERRKVVSESDGVLAAINS